MTGIDHPAWCSPARCTTRSAERTYERGEHRSEPIELDGRRLMTNRGAVPATSAFLSKAHCPWGTDTFLRLAYADDELTMPVSQAAGVLLQLTELVGLTDH